MLSPIPLTLRANEFEILPEVPSVQDLLHHEGDCRTQLMPGFTGPASAISAGTFGPGAGTFRPNWWSGDPNVQLGEVNLFKVSNAYFFPAYGVILDQSGMVMNCSMSQATYITPDLVRLPNIELRGESSVFLPPDTIETLERAIVTMPWGAVHNYGHFLLDCLSAVALLVDVDGLSTDDLAFPQTLKRFHSEHFEMLRITPRILPNDVYRVQTALFTDCMSHFLHAPNRNYNLLREKQLTKLGPGSRKRRKIYLGRDDGGKRKFASEALLMSELRARGFDIVVAESLSVADQIATFAEADVIVAGAGAGLANVLYSSPGSVVIEIQPRGIESRWVGYICLLMNCRWAPYFCNSTPPENVRIVGGKPRPDLGMSFDLDIADFLSYVDRVVQNPNEVTA